MPKCPVCKGSARSRDLKQVGDSLCCGECRRPKVLKEKKMAEKMVGEKTKLVSFHIYEIPTKDGAKDHEVEAEVNVGGFNLQYTTTFDKVRKFFAEQREKGKAATLKVVP